MKTPAALEATAGGQAYNHCRSSARIVCRLVAFNALRASENPVPPHEKSSPSLGALLRHCLAAAAEARARGDHGLAEQHENDAARALRAALVAAVEARHG